MASINRRGRYWRVQIRKLGCPYLSATFDTRATAFMAHLRQMPHKVTSHFRHPSARYAMSGL